MSQPASAPRIPSLRFPEFSGEWEEKRLGELALVNPKSSQLPDEFFYIDLESVEKGKLLKYNLIDKIDAPSRAQRLLQKKDIIFQMVRPYQGNNYFFESEGVFVASTGYAQIRTSHNAKYIYHFLHTEDFVTNVINRCAGSSYPAINSNDLADIYVQLPSLPEQTKIAAFLSAVDSKIDQLSQKKALLEQYKKGVMQQIFSQQIRFKADDGSEYPEWEEKKLGEIFSYKNGASYESFVVEDGAYSLITLNSIDIDGNLKIEHKKVNLNDNSLSKNDLIMVLSDVAHGNFLGLTAIIPADDMFVLNQRMGALKPKTNDSISFMRAYINFNQKYFKLHGQGSSQQNLSKGDIENFVIKLPCLSEQTKIANFLSAIDSKIEQVAQQLEAAKQFKKGLLQQMFV